MTRPLPRSIRRALLAALLALPIVADLTFHSAIAHADTLDSIAKSGVLHVAVPADL